MANSNNFDLLNYTWTMWHNKAGAPIRLFYQRYIELSNAGARLNNFSDYGEMWRSKYEDPNFIQTVNKMWKQIEPLYDELHEYTRNKLIVLYGDKMNKSDPLIPAHLLGDMWADTWLSLYDRIKPFNESQIDITNMLKVL